MKEELIKINFDKEKYIALSKRTPKKCSNGKQVLLTHGTLSNRKVLNAISDFLIKNNFTCWIFEWRNHGLSSKIKEPFNFETIGKEDFKLVFDYLFDLENISNLHCITHSGGGICLSIALIDYPKYQSKIKSITMFGAQAFGAGISYINYSKIYLSKIVCKILGYIPARKLGGGGEDESYYFMKQWFNWNLSGEFKGESGIDYQEKLKNIRVPILSIYGKGDTFIAPPKGCELFLAAFKNSINQSLYCSKENGFAEDYNHGRILHSRNASKEIYPIVLQWIEKHSIKINPPTGGH